MNEHQFPNEREQDRGGRKLRLIYGTDLTGEPPEREWHVDPLIPTGTVTLLGGDGGVGKSLLAMQLAIATASPGNSKWCGRRVSDGPAVYVSAEDDEDELHRRVRAICTADGIDADELFRLTIVPLAGEDAVFAAPGGTGLKTTPLFIAIEAQLKKEPTALLVLDTLADLFAGDENVRAHARQFIGLLRGLAIRHHCAVVVLAHPSLSGISSGSGTSGSTGWSNSVRSRLYLDRVKAEDGFETDPNVRVLRTMKSNYGPIGGEIRLRWQDGAFVTTEAGFISSFNATAERATAERIFLELLAKFDAEGRHVSAHGTANNFAPTAFARHPQSGGINKRGFQAAMDRLFASNMIRVGQSEAGPPSRRKEIIKLIDNGGTDSE
ncbi:MAG: AAA family ATPase [Cypionkella sp.]